MNKSILQPIIGGILSTIGLILCIVGFTGYTPAEKINADVVLVIGSKAVLYKPNPEKPIIQLK